MILKIKFKIKLNTKLVDTKYKILITRKIRFDTPYSIGSARKN